MPGRPGGRRRVRWAPASSVSLAAVLLAAAACAPGRPASHRPPVLLITLDTTRADALGCYGGAARTPNLDALARHGASFRTAVATAPLTLPSHATLLTGVYPPSHGARHNGMFRVPGDVTTLAERLSRRGYATAAVVGSAVLDSLFGLDQGFDRYLDFGLDPSSPRNTSGPAERPADEVVRLASTLVRESRGGRPLFLWVHFYDPHAPYAPPPPFAGEFPDRPYLGEVSFVDAAVGRLLRLFDRMRAGEPALVVVAGDHGEALGDHGEPTHGLTLYESTIRVPLIIAMEGRVAPGRVVDDLAGLVDVVPTLVDLLGMVPQGAAAPLDGRSLAEACRRREGPGDRAPADRAVYLETLYPLHALGWSGITGIRTPRWKYVRAPVPEIYDLASDPGEGRNLLAGTREPTPRERALAARLARLARESESGHPDALLPAPLARAAGARLQALGYVGSTGTAGRAGSPRERGGRVPPPRDPKDLAGIGETARSLEETLLEGGSQEVLDSLEALPPGIAHRLFLQHLRAEALVGLGRPGEALEVYRRILGRNGRDAVAAVRLAALLLEGGDAGESEEMLALAEQNAGDSWEVYAAAGALFLRRGEPAPALERFDRAARIAPLARSGILLGRGRALRALGRTEEAARSLLAAVALDPGDRGAKLELADLQVARGRTQEALNLLGPWIPPRGEDPRAMEVAARARMERGELREAGVLLGELLRGHPDSVEGHRLQGALFLGRRWYLRARDAYREALRLGGERPGVLEDLAGVLLEPRGGAAHDPAEALDLARRAESLAPRHARAVLLEVRALRALGREGEATERARAALTAPLDDPSLVRRELEGRTGGG